MRLWSQTRVVISSLSPIFFSLIVLITMYIRFKTKPHFYLGFVHVFLVERRVDSNDIRIILKECHILTTTILFIYSYMMSFDSELAVLFWFFCMEFGNILLLPTDSLDSRLSKVLCHFCLSIPLPSLWKLVK